MSRSQTLIDDNLKLRGSQSVPNITNQTMFSQNPHPGTITNVLLLSKRKTAQPCQPGPSHPLGGKGEFLCRPRRLQEMVGSKPSGTAFSSFH